MDGIVLLAKTPGKTSFSSLFNVKKALNTTKVGHTGTLDSFAQGLLVVCTGRYTKLVSNITSFNKTYLAVISFGKETDTLEYTGNVIATSKLPLLDDLQKALNSFQGPLLQEPPSFSAIHIDGKRASDLARSGKSVELAKRPITVYNSKLIDVLMDGERVLSCLVEFEVSKGTYIRALARDIAKECNSVAYLSGLYRTKVGNFNVENAAGFSLINNFNIDNCLKVENEYLSANKEVCDFQKDSKKEYSETSEDILIKKEVIEKIVTLDEKIAIECGFYPLHLKGGEQYFSFMHGKPLKKNYFCEYIESLKNEKTFAVFYDNAFCGLLKNEQGFLSYSFVNN